METEVKLCFENKESLFRVADSELFRMFCVTSDPDTVMLENYYLDTKNRVFILYKSITNFPFINPDYIFDIYNKFKEESEANNYRNFLEFLDYFKKTYLITYEIKYWNYYDHIEHITNNACESYNAKLNNLFQKNQHFLNYYTKYGWKNLR